MTLASALARRFTCRATSRAGGLDVGGELDLADGRVLGVLRQHVVDADQHRHQVAVAEAALGELGVDLRRQVGGAGADGGADPVRRVEHRRAGRVAGREDEGAEVPPPAVWIQIGLKRQSIVGSVAEAVPLTLNLWPLKLPSMSRMLLVSSPKAMMRLGSKSESARSLPPQEASSSIAASTPQPIAARRACFAISLIRIKLQETGNSGCRGAAEPVSDAVPFGTRRRLLDPDEMHAVVVEFAQHGK